MRRRATRSIRLLLTVCAVVALWWSTGAVASAHVEAEGDTDAAGVTTVTFSFHHGCAGEATTGLRVQLPAGTTDVVPQDAPTGWSGFTSVDGLEWVGGSVPDDEEATFVARMRLVGAAGATVFLPTIQVCGAAEQAWITQSDDPEADGAAPRVVLSAEVAPASSAAPTSAAPSTTAPSPSSAVDATTPPNTGDSVTSSTGELEEDAGGGLSSGVVVAIVAAAVVVLGIGAVAVRRRSAGSSGPDAE